MEKFLISPDDCVVLKAFKDTSSLREAASMLKCDPAGLTRKIQYISSEYGLIQKVNNRWQLTSLGLDLVAWTEMSIQGQKKILLGKSAVRIGSSMWFADDVLIPNIERLKNIFQDNFSFSFSAPSKKFEIALIDGSVDFVITCYVPEVPEIDHQMIANEEWVLVAPSVWGLSEDTSIEELKTLPFIRHKEMNIDLFIPDISPSLNDSGLSFDNLVGIRSAINQGLGWGIVPRFLVNEQVKSGKFTKVNYDLKISDRKICVWWLRSRYDVRKSSAKICRWIEEVCLSLEPSGPISSRHSSELNIKIT